MFDTANMVTVRNWTQTCKNNQFHFHFRMHLKISSFLFCAHACAFCIHILQIPITKRAHTSKHNYFQIYQNNVMLL